MGTYDSHDKAYRAAAWLALENRYGGGNGFRIDEYTTEDKCETLTQSEGTTEET